MALRHLRRRVYSALVQIEPLTEKEYRRREYLESVRDRGPGSFMARDILIPLAGIALVDLFLARGNLQGWIHALKSTAPGEWISAAIAGCILGLWEWSGMEKELAKLDARQASDEGTRTTKPS